MKNIILIVTILFASAFYCVAKGQNTVVIMVNNVQDSHYIEVITPSNIIENIQAEKSADWQMPFNFNIIKVINKSRSNILGIKISPFSGRNIIKLNPDTSRKIVDFDVREDVRKDETLWQKTNEITLEIIYKSNGIIGSPRLLKLYKKDTTVKEAKISINKYDYAPRRYPFYDALLLHKMLKNRDISPNDTSLLKEILCAYAGIPNDYTLGELRYIYKNNTFISEYLLRSVPMVVFGRYQSFEALEMANTNGKNKPVLTRMGSSIGGLNATVFADAFAKIIVKRFKQDLNELFFEKMKEDMAESVELTTLFPRTYGLLSQIDTEIYGFDKYIESLRQKIEEDLANTFANTTAFLETEKYKSAFDGNQPVRGFLMSVFQFADGLVQNKHPGDILENLHFNDAYDGTSEGQTLKANLQTARLLSMGLQDKAGNTSHYWVRGLDSLYLLFKGKDAGAAKIWLGLIHALAVDEDDPSVPIVFGNGTTLRDYINYLNTPSEDPFSDRAQDFISGLMQKVNEIERSYKSLNETKKQNEDGKVYWEQLAGLYENAIGLVKYAPKLQEVFDKDAAMPYNWHRGIFLAETLPRIYAEMKARQYHSAISHITELMKAADFRKLYLYKKNFDPKRDMDALNLNKQVLYQRVIKKKKTDKEIYAPLREYAPIFGKYIKVSEKQYRLIDSIFIYKKEEKTLSSVDYAAVDKFFKYGNFAAALVLAKTSDEVQSLLEATMSPPGSSRIKESGVVFGINSYLGLQGTVVHDKSMVSVSAPIGINLSINRLWKPKHRLIKESNFGKKIAPRNAQFLLSLVDLGGLTRWRLTNDTTTAPKITVNDIFAPGIYAMLGRFGGTPLNISIGFQTQPLLYRINSATIQYRENTRFRGSLNLSWDIPFWNITYRKRRNFERRD
jgi:hypothetical protein